MVRVVAALCVLSVLACSQQRPAPVARTDTEGLDGQGYVIRPGDTLSSIAERYGTSIEDIVEANRISDPDRVRAGSRIVVPDRKPVEKVEVPEQGRVVVSEPVREPSPKVVREEAKNDPATAEMAVPPQREAEPRQRPRDVIVAPAEPAPTSKSDDDAGAPLAGPSVAATKPQANPQPDTEAAAASQPSVPEISQAAVSGFSWPVDGQLLNKFGPGGGGDGIDIAVPEGTPVKAALGGDVIYAGNSLSGYGNLVLLRHEDGLVTAYAYNQELLVKKGARVLQGEVVASSGRTGAARQAALHFEVRRGTQPVDPLTFLPPR